MFDVTHALSAAIDNIDQYILVTMGTNSVSMAMDSAFKVKSR